MVDDKNKTLLRIQRRAEVLRGVRFWFHQAGFLEVDAITGKLTIRGFSENDLQLGFLEKLDALNRDLAAAEALISQGVDFVNDVLNCVNDFKLFLDSTQGSNNTTGAGGLGTGGSNTYVNSLAEANRSVTIQKITEAQDFITRCNKYFCHVFNRARQFWLLYEKSPL